MVLQNVVSYVGQLDNHAAYLTVQETFDFAAKCRIGKAKATSSSNDNDLSENLTIDGLDLAVCRDTYVGDANTRGVSGGQRRRVTLGEKASSTSKTCNGRYTSPTRPMTAISGVLESP